jgi:predicted RNase H-like HicB family nuclease
MVFSVIIEGDIEGYCAGIVQDLRGCHTQAKSLDSRMERVRLAAELWQAGKEHDPASILSS